MKEANENSNSIVITHNGEAQAALVDIVQYEQAQQSFPLLNLLAQSKDGYQQGSYKPAKD